jgi:hypothetical protein
MVAASGLAGELRVRERLRRGGGSGGASGTEKNPSARVGCGFYIAPAV